MTDLQLSPTPSLDDVEHHRCDDHVVRRLHTRAGLLSERSLDLRRSSYSEPHPVGVAMRRRAAELDLNAVALRLAADGLAAPASS